MNRHTNHAVIAAVALALQACSTITVPRYAVRNAAQGQQLKVADVGVAAFAEPAAFGATCRGNVIIAMPEALGPAAYVRNALHDELRIAGATNEGNPRIWISGSLTSLQFTTSSGGGADGYWLAKLDLKSTNGTAMSAEQFYSFPANAFDGNACQNAARAFPNMVQDLVGKVVGAPEFRALIR